MARDEKSESGYPRHTTTDLRSVADHLADLQVIPEDASVITTLDRMIDRAMGFRATMRLVLADDECEHGGHPNDTAAQPGCQPGCPGYPQAPRPPGLVAGRARRVGRELHSLCVTCGAHFTQPARQGRPFTRCDDCRS